MRIGSVVLVIWLLIGVIAAAQRDYFSGGEEASCAKTGTVLVTIVAGPLNYFGLNPKVKCTTPQPSK